MSNNDKVKRKKINQMLHVVCGDISNRVVYKKDLNGIGEIDTIVNAAKPTLMGSNQGVDGAIHKAVDECLRKCDKEFAKKYDDKSLFNIKICEELDEGKKEIENRIRCSRGHAVLTKGYGLCKYIIHVVGAVCDIEEKEEPLWNICAYIKMRCSSSRLRQLESCYYEIVKVIREHPDIKNIAIPIIGSGEYKFPFELAVKTAISSIGNALFEWQQEDAEYFSDKSEGVQNIIFFIWNADEEKRKEYFDIAERVLVEYKAIYEHGAKVAPQNSFSAQVQYLVEICRYDKNRGYFCIARFVRLALSLFRLLSLYTYIKDLFGRHNWQRRRFWVEITVFVKTVFAIIMAIIFWKYGNIADRKGIFGLINILLAYNLADTITYLMCLLLMADIQKPSANVIRSILLLLLNYVEVSMEMVCLFYQRFASRNLSFLEALDLGLLGGSLPEKINIAAISDGLLFYGNAALKFFFITMVFGYLSGHLRQRRFQRMNS